MSSDTTGVEHGAADTSRPYKGCGCMNCDFARMEAKRSAAIPRRGWTELLYANGGFGMWGVLYVHTPDGRAPVDADEHQERSLCFWLGREGRTDDAE